MAELDVAAEASKLAERVELAIGGKLYAGWTSISIDRSLDSLSGSFELALASKAATADADFPIAAGDRCEVRITGEVVIDGWVDMVAPSIDAQEYGVSVSGRDRTADLADCAAIHKSGSWRNVRLEAIAAELAKPFGLSVTAKVSTGAPITRFALQQGETVHAALERLLRFRGLLLNPTSKGDLEIVKVNDAAPIGTLELGVNVKAAVGTFDHRERFSEYRVKGQAAGSDAHHGKPVTQLSGTATDPGVKRYRPMLVIAEEQTDRAGSAVRARWEAGVRAGKSRTAQITTLGWRISPGGALLRPNTRVRVKCPKIHIADEVMLITGVAFKKGDDGTTATVTVMPPGAWQQLAESERKK